MVDDKDSGEGIKYQWACELPLFVAVGVCAGFCHAAEMSGLRAGVEGRNFESRNSLVMLR